MTLKESPESVLPVDDRNYPGFLTGNAVVSFGIASCQPCVEFDPILREAAKNYSGKVKFGKAKMHLPGACREIKRRHSFDTFPTTHFYKNGELVHSLDVKVGLDELCALIERYLLAHPDGDGED